MTNVHGIPVTGGSLPADIWRAFMSALPSPQGSLGVGSSSAGASSSYGGTGASGPSGDRPSEAEVREDPAPEESAPPPAEEDEEEPGIIPEVIPTGGSPPGT